MFDEITGVLPWETQRPMRMQNTNHLRLITLITPDWNACIEDRLIFGMGLCALAMLGVLARSLQRGCARAADQLQTPGRGAQATVPLC